MSSDTTSAIAARWLILRRARYSPPDPEKEAGRPRVKRSGRRRGDNNPATPLTRCLHSRAFVGGTP